MEFRELLAAFAAKYRRRALVGLREAESVRTEAQAVNDSHHDMLSSGYFHV